MLTITRCLITALAAMMIGSFAAAAEEIDAGALFESKCSICHSINRPKSKTKTAEEWESTVMRMKNVNGCPVSDEEAEIIIEYLSEHYGK